MLSPASIVNVFTQLVCVVIQAYFFDFVMKPHTTVSKTDIPINDK